MGMIIGIDYASVDGNIPPTWSRAARAGASFAIIRGAYGTDIDPNYARDAATARAAGFVLGSYLFLRYDSKAPSPEAQANALIDHVDVLHGRDLPPALDVEFPKGRAALGMTVDEALARTKRAWLVLANYYNVSPMIYTSARVWAEDLDNKIVPEFADSIAWLAKPWPWAVNTPARISATDQRALASGQYDPRVPPIWDTKQWWFHQYQGDATLFPGFTSTVDVSRMKPMVIGESGARVAWAQRRMGVKATGVYDDAFGVALRKFQSIRGLTADGIIGPRTLAALAWCAGVESPLAPGG